MWSGRAEAGRIRFLACDNKRRILGVCPGGPLPGMANRSCNGDGCVRLKRGKAIAALASSYGRDFGVARILCVAAIVLFSRSALWPLAATAETQVQVNAVVEVPASPTAGFHFPYSSVPPRHGRED